MDLATCFDFIGSVAHDAMCTMPNLKVLKADTLLDMDMLEDGRAWVCERLKELQLVIKLDQPRSVTQPIILSRLSKLTRLENYQMSHRSIIQTGPGSFTNVGGRIPAAGDSSKVEDPPRT
jgi:hypothetical protein